MSKIDELLAQLCPNGVEFMTLGELGTFLGGLSGKSKEDFKDGNAKFITYMNVFSNISLNLDVTDTVKIGEGEKQNTIQYGDVLFTGSSETPNECGMSSVLTVKTAEMLYLNSFCFIYRFNDPELFLPSFSKYLFRSDYLRKQIIKTASGVTRFNVSKAKMAKVKIPVPPLDVQAEIVKVLDNFTELTAKLTAELTARKKQYEYYRDLLLDFGVHGGATGEYEWQTVRLGDICSIITKGTTPKSYEKTGVAFIKTEAFVGRYIDKSKLSFVSEETHIGFLKRSILQENDILFTIAGATIGKMAIVTADILPANTNQACAIIRLKDNNDLGYVKYILESEFMKNYMKQCIKGSAQPNLNLQQLNDFKFPYPITDKKIEIVSILDRFDKLCNDISEGLPAEIEARRKQYEYYRDKLLSFEERKNA